MDGGSETAFRRQEEFNNIQGTGYSHQQSPLHMDAGSIGYDEPSSQLAVLFISMVHYYYLPLRKLHHAFQVLSEHSWERIHADQALPPAPTLMNKSIPSLPLESSPEVVPPPNRSPLASIPPASLPVRRGGRANCSRAGLRKHPASSSWWPPAAA